MKTHKQLILGHLKNNYGITSIEAITKYNCTRLSAVILELKKDGYFIMAINKKINGKTFAEYRISDRQRNIDLFGKPEQLSDIDKEIEIALSQY